MPGQKRERIAIRFKTVPVWKIRTENWWETINNEKQMESFISSFIRSSHTFLYIFTLSSTLHAGHKNPQLTCSQGIKAS